MGTQDLTAVVVGSMPVPPKGLVSPLLTQRVMVICADGGLHRAGELDLTPDFYVGDSDSGGSPPEELDNWLLPGEKDLTDLEMGVRVAMEKGAGRIVLCGCSGGRADHHLANLYLLEWLALKGVQAFMVDEINRITCLLPGQYRITPPDYRYFGLIPLDRQLQGLTLRGCKYPLDSRDVIRGSTLTISNQALPGMELEIGIQSGAALLVFSQPGA